MSWLFLGIPLPGLAFKLRSATLRVPDHVLITLNGGITLPKGDSGREFKAYFPGNLSKTVTLTVKDPFGIMKEYSLPELVQSSPYMEIESGIITAGKANPEEINILPSLCPRLAAVAGEANLVYDTDKDFLNDKPRVQLMDPDASASATQRNLLTKIDDQNVLRVVRAKISYDYEDSGILDYEGTDPVSGNPGHKVYEGEGGFYANFHYAVMPYDARYAELPRQEFLHLIQGKLAEIKRDDLRPEMRTHSFLPGPYLSKGGVYSMCEWGDTAHQAKNQELRYKDLRIWDWDLAPENNSNTVMLVVWEGDEEEWMQRAGMIPEHYLTDDVVGVFVLDRETTLKRELVLKNENGDFEMTVITDT